MKSRSSNTFVILLLAAILLCALRGYSQAISLFGGMSFSPSPLRVSEGKEMQDPLTIRIVGTNDKGELVAAKDSGVPVAESFDPKTGKLGSEMYTHAVNVVWQFAKAGITFEAEGVTHKAEKAGATISFTKDGVRMDGIRKIKEGSAAPAQTQFAEPERGGKQMPAAEETPIPFDKRTLGEMQGKHATWNAVVKGGSIQVYSESNSKYVIVPINKVAMPNEGSKLIVSGTIDQVFQETYYIGKESKECVAIRMKDCKVEETQPNAETGDLSSARRSEQPAASSTSPAASNMAREAVGIATYDGSKVLSSYGPVKEAYAKLQDELPPLQRELDTLSASIEKMKGDYEKKKDTLEESEQKKLEVRIRSEYAKYQEMLRGNQSYIDKKEEAIMAPVMRELEATAETVGKSMGFNSVVRLRTDGSKMDGSKVEGTDITENVIEYFCNGKVVPSTLKQRTTDSPFLSQYAIPEIQAVGSTMTETDVILEATDNPNVFTTSTRNDGGRMEILLPNLDLNTLTQGTGTKKKKDEGKTATTVQIEDMTWHEGARHTLKGTLKIQGYTFVSDATDPLVFRVTSKAYVYERGRGTVVTPRGEKVVLGSNQ
jgi:Skp family chaperone for outer membrane proteins